MENGIMLGLYAGYASSKVSYSDQWLGDYGWSTTFIIIGGRATYEFDLFNDPKIDTYVGGILGYNIVRTNVFGDQTVNIQGVSWFTYNGFVGIRYGLGSNLSIFAEAGYGISYFTGGITKKF